MYVATDDSKYSRTPITLTSKGSKKTVRVSGVACRIAYVAGACARFRARAPRSSRELLAPPACPNTVRPKLLRPLLCRLPAEQALLAGLLLNLRYPVNNAWFTITKHFGTLRRTNRLLANYVLCTVQLLDVAEFAYLRIIHNG